MVSPFPQLICLFLKNKFEKQKKKWDEWINFDISFSLLKFVFLELSLHYKTLILYAFRKRQVSKGKGDADGAPFQNGDMKKKPLEYDELSIPFIDASPAPTPKVGRSTDRYSSSYLRRTNKLLTRPAEICVCVPIEGTECKIQWAVSTFYRYFLSNQSCNVRH